MAGAANFGSMATDLRNMALSFAAIETSVHGLDSSIQTWREFSSQITLANAVAHGTSVEFEQMSQAAQNFALSSKASMKDVADALYYLNSAGFTTGQSLMAMTSIVQLAQSTMTDFGTAARLVATSLDAFGLSANDAARVSNLFVAAAHDSQSTVQTLSFALRQVGPAAAAAGLSIEQTTTFIDLLSNAGLTGQQAGTALRNVLVRLQDPVGQGGKLFSALGISLHNSNGQARDSIAVLRDLANINITLSDATQLVGRQSAVAFLQMLKDLRDTEEQAGKTTSAFDEHLKKISDTNEAYRQAVAQMDTMDGAMTRMQHAGQELKLMFGQALAPTVADSANAFADWVRKIKDATDAQKMAFGETFLGVIGIGLLGATVLKSVTAVKNYNQGLIDLETAMGKATAAQTAYAEAQASFTAGTIAEEEALLAMRTELVAEAVAFEAMGASLMSMATAALPLFILAGAILAVGAAMFKVKDAYDQSQMDKFGKNYYESVARTNPGALGGYTSADLSQNRNKVPDDIARNLREVPDQYPVGQDKQGNPTGFANRATAYQTQIEIIQDQINLNDKQIKDMDVLLAKRRELQAKTNQIMRDAREINGGGAMLFGAASLNGGPQDKNFDDAIAKQLELLSSTNYKNLPAAVNAFYANVSIAIDQSKTLSDKDKADAKAKAQEFGQALASAPPEVLAAIQPALAEAGAKLESGDIRGAEEALRQTGQFSASTIKGLADEAKKNNEKLRVSMAQAQAQASAQLPQVKQELQAYANNMAKGNKEVAQMLADISKVDPSIWDKAMHDVDYNFNNLDRYIQALAEEAKKRGLHSATLVQQSAAQGFLPLIDIGTTESDLAKAKIEAAKAQARYAQTLGKPVGDVAGMLLGPNNSLFDNAHVQEEVEKVTTRIAAEKGGVSLDEKEGFKRALGTVLRKHQLNVSDKDMADIIAQAGLSPTNARQNAQRIQNEIQAANFRYYAQFTDALNEVAGYSNKTNRKAAAAQRHSDIAIARTFNIPDEDEFKDSIQQLAIKHEFFNADWFNEPIGKATEQLQLEVLKGQKAIDDYYKKSYKTIATDIFKDTPLAANKALHEILTGSGSVKFDGKNYAGTDLFNSDNVSKLLDNTGPLKVLLDTMTKGLKGPEAKAQTEAARTMLLQMGQMLGPLGTALEDTKRKFATLRDTAIFFKQEGDALRAKFGTTEGSSGLVGTYLNALVGSGTTDVGLISKLTVMKAQAEAADAAVAQIKAITDAANASLRQYGTDITTALKSGNNSKEVQDIVDQFLRVKKAVEEASDTIAARIPSEWSTHIQALKAQIEALKSQADQLDSGDTLKGFEYGLKAGVMKTFSEIPSTFEVGLQAMSTGVDRFADLFAKMAAGMKVNFRQATASILADIAQMIIKMIILRTIEAAMGFSGGGTAGSGAGGMTGAPDIPLTAAYGAVAFAGGGGANWATANDLFGGGVKRPGDTTHAIFGEGTMPEAFIPMMDGRTVQMAIGADGKLHVPLPSGKAIPVSLRSTGHKFADGGASNDHLMNAAGSTAMSTRGGHGGSIVHVNFGDTNNRIELHHTSNGGNGMDDEALKKHSDALTAHVNAIWDAREAAFAQKMVKQGGMLSPSHSASGGFGRLGRG